LAADGDVGIDDLVRRIRDEAARRAKSTGPVASSPGSTHVETDQSPGRSPPDLPRWESPTDKFSIKSRYTIGDFLAFDDEAFVRNAYTAILQRDADPKGLSDFLSGLRRDRWSKTDVLGRLRYSREGRARAVPVSGLLPRFAFSSLGRAPLLGPLVAFVGHLIALPSIARDVDRLRSAAHRHQQETAQYSNAVADATERSLRRLHRIASDAGATASAAMEQLPGKAGVAEVERLEHHMSQLGKTLGQASDLLDLRTRLAGVAGDISALQQAGSMMQAALAGKADTATMEALAARVGGAPAVEDRLAAIGRELADHDRRLADQRRQLVTFRHDAESAKRLASIDDNAAGDTQDRGLDSFYVAFEDAFRGSREEIKERVAVYVDLVKAAGAGTAVAPIIDVACGRGEWLELLRDEQLIATGVDINPLMIAECRQRGLEVEEADLLAYLRSCADGSAGGITGLHVIEHLPFEGMIDLFDQTLRVLRPGGLAIFETPNPENLIVGSCNFYYDPTHRKPLPPEAMRFAMAARGFADVRILRLRPVALPESGSDPTIKILRDMLAAAPDYAIIGVRA